MGTDEEQIRESTPNATGPDRAAGDMGVSSERRGPVSGEYATDGTRDTSTPPETPAPDADEPPEQRPGNPETNPEGIPPKAGYSSLDPRSS